MDGAGRINTSIYTYLTVISGNSTTSPSTFHTLTSFVKAKSSFMSFVDLLV